MSDCLSECTCVYTITATMSLNIIIFLSILCAVNASVVIIVYDDHINGEVSLDSDCDPQGCDQLCRRLGFTGGACVGDKCKCDINSDAEKGNISSDKAKTSFDEFLRYSKAHKRIDDHNNEEVSLDSDCNPQGCDQLCRRLGFTGGVCVGDKCKCDINSDAEKSDIPAKKSNTAFDKFLQSLKGYDNFEENLIEIEPKRKYPKDRYTVDQSQEECKDASCDDLCRKLGLPGGACKDGKCYCNKMESIENLLDFVPKRHVSKCNPVTCNSQCVLIGYHWGTCRADFCQCF